MSQGEGIKLKLNIENMHFFNVAHFIDFNTD